MKSALMRPPPRANSTRARRVSPRLPPSPTTRQRSSLASTRIASLERSWAASSVSSLALTTVPMPPFHSRSTGARRMSRIRSLGASESSSIPSARCAASDSGIHLAVRGHTPPPSEIFARS